MALFNCPECQREISDKASSCPHCGQPIPKTKGKKPQNTKKGSIVEKGFGCLILFVIIACVIGFCTEQNTENSNDEPPIKKRERTQTKNNNYRDVIIEKSEIVNRIPNIKLSISYDIKERYTENELLRFCKQELKRLDSYDRYFFEFWLEGMTKDAGAYAAFQYENGKLITNQFAQYDPSISKNFQEKAASTGDQIIGTWHDDFMGVTHIIIERNGKYIDKWVMAGEMLEKPLRKISSKKFDYVEEQGAYYQIESNGHLGVYDNQGLIATYTKVN